MRVSTQMLPEERLSLCEAMQNVGISSPQPLRMDPHEGCLPVEPVPDHLEQVTTYLREQPAEAVVQHAPGLSFCILYTFSTSKYVLGRQLETSRFVFEYAQAL